MSHSLLIIVLVLLTIFAYRWLNDDTTPEMDVAVERSDDPVVPPKKCSGLCPYNLAPVCGYDTSSGTSMSYPNDCVFSAAQCQNPNVKLLNKGKCPDSKGAVGKVGAAVVVPPKKCGKACYSIYAPVCGYDSENGTSKEYANDCVFSAAQCRNPNLKLLNDGKCPGDSKTQPPPPKDPKCDKPCPNNEANVCAYKSGDPSHTYFRNKCLFLNAQCKDPSWIFVNEGRCPDGLANYFKMNRLLAK